MAPRQLMPRLRLLWPWRLKVTQVMQGEPPDQVTADHPKKGLIPDPGKELISSGEVLQAPATWRAEPDHWGYLLPIQAAEPIALPEPEPAPLPPAPADWFTAAEAAELLGISRSTILRWCKQRRLGEPGENWLPAGRTFKVSPEIIELLLGVQEPAAPTYHQG